MSRRKKPVYISPVVEEIQKLSTLEEDDKASDDDLRRLDRLRSQRHREQRDAFPKLICCDTGRTSTSILFHIDVYESGPSDKVMEGQWRLSEYSEMSHQRLIEIQQSGDPEWHKRRPAEPKFCPYCATPIPKMRRMKNPPKDITVVTDGGYYCDTCQERLRCCMCLPPEAAFEPVP